MQFRGAAAFWSRTGVRLCERSNARTLCQPSTAPPSGQIYPDTFLAEAQRQGVSSLDVCNSLFAIFLAVQADGVLCQFAIGFPGGAGETGEMQQLGGADLGAGAVGRDYH